MAVTNFGSIQLSALSDHLVTAAIPEPTRPVSVNEVAAAGEQKYP